MKYGKAVLLSRIHFKDNESFFGEDMECSNDSKKSKTIIKLIYGMTNSHRYIQI